MDGISWPYISRALLDRKLIYHEVVEYCSRHCLGCSTQPDAQWFNILHEDIIYDLIMECIRYCRKALANEGKLLLECHILINTFIRMTRIQTVQGNTSKSIAGCPHSLLDTLLIQHFANYRGPSCSSYNGELVNQEAQEAENSCSSCSSSSSHNGELVNQEAQEAENSCSSCSSHNEELVNQEAQEAENCLPSKLTCGGASLALELENYEQQLKKRWEERENLIISGLSCFRIK